MDGEDSDGDTKFEASDIPLPPPLIPPRKYRRLGGPLPNPSKHEYTPRLLHEHRSRLTRLLRRLVDDHNWGDAALALSVLDKFSPKGGHGYTMMDLRKNYLAAIQVVLRNEADSVSPAKIRQLCDIWTRKLIWSKMCVRERNLIQLELALFFLIHGRTTEAHQITKFLLKESEITNDPKLHLVHGMALFEIWYSGLPKEMQLDGSGMHLLLQLKESFNDNVEQINAENTRYHSSSRKSELKVSRSHNSYSSIDNYEEARVEINHPQKKPSEDFFSGSLPACGSVRSDEEKDKLPYSDTRYPSIFSCYGVDTRLLPIRLDNLSGSIEEKVHHHVELLDENYTGAVSHLHDALFSEPPLFAALLPYVQILLLGDQVEEALQKLKIFCQHSTSALAFRLRAALLEVFCKNQLTEICNCHETVLKKDPTCSSSLERLIGISKDGNYGRMSLLEMIVLHLDAATGNCNIWDELASCLLIIQTSRVTGYDQDLISTNVTPLDHHPSARMSVNFLKQEGRKSWEMRCRWWSKHHFSKSRYLREMQTGDWKLLTCKAASASHLYGPTFEYVDNACRSLIEKGDDMNLSFLQNHIENPLKLYNILTNRIQ